ncbi:MULTISPECIES: S1 family peptidase [Streptomyces]|uniref:S1 family peptidase n=1 Tax=Streptomyces durocortorensis TaxID=2811104 RepID=A0ABS2HXR3_9ACTN|nr:S1 family peptidase [Streptomyces durocortorensis]MBM7055227.1 S1 family peptidase [Streptomyces durocortorensis]
MRLSRPHSLTRRARFIAGATGLAAAAALAVPATAASAQPAPKTFSATELNQTAASVRTADVGGTAWYVDGASGKVVVTADSTVSKAEIAKLKSEAGTNADALVVKRTPGTFSKLIAGGEAITTGGARCSLGFNVQDGAGTKFALTAGHCTNIGSSWSIGTTTGSSFPGDDYGIIQHSDPGAADGRVSLYNGSYQEIDGAADATVGQSVQRSGSTTGLHGGSVTGLNATVNYGADGIVSGLIQTNVCAEPGDSGGALFSGSTALGLTSGGSGNCSSGGTTFYQPVTEALSVYGVSII